MASGGDHPALRVHWHDPGTDVLRQGTSVRFTAPFLFLLFGGERVLLLDTGAEADPEDFPLRAAVDRLVETRVERNDITGRHPLVVGHDAIGSPGRHVSDDVVVVNRMNS